MQCPKLLFFIIFSIFIYARPSLAKDGDNLFGHYIYADSINNLRYLFEDVDSVQVKFTSYYDTETSYDGQVIPDKGIYYMKSAILTEPEIKQLNKFLFSGKSFTNSFSALSYSDIDITFFKNDIINCKITISSITRDYVFNKNDNLYIGRISKKFEGFITGLLIKKDIWNENNYYRFMEF